MNPKMGAPEKTTVLSTEITVLREELDRLLADLDRRRHDAFNLKRQLGRHPFAAAATLGLAAGAIALALHRRREAARPRNRARRFGGALKRMFESPERVAKPAPSFGRKVVAGVITAALATVAKQLVMKGMRAAA